MKKCLDRFASYVVLVIIVAFFLGGCAVIGTSPRDVPGFSTIDASSAKDYPEMVKWLKPLAGKFSSNDTSTRPASLVVTSVLSEGKKCKLTYSYGNVSYDNRGKPRMNNDNKVLSGLEGEFIDENTMMFHLPSGSTLTCRWQPNGDVKVSYVGSGTSEAIFREVHEAVAKN